jgi:hypothetical protein
LERVRRLPALWEQKYEVNNNAVVRCFLDTSVNFPVSFTTNPGIAQYGLLSSTDAIT